MNIDISPAKAVVKHCLSKGGCGLQEINDKCYSLASAFNGNCGVFDIPKKMTNECDNLVEQSKNEIYGANKNKQTPYKPVLYREPHNYPILFYENMKKNDNCEQNKNDSLSECIGLCLNQECKDYCRLSNDVINCNNKEGFSTSIKKIKTRDIFFVLLLVFLIFLLFKYES